MKLFDWFACVFNFFAHEFATKETDGNDEVLHMWIWLSFSDNPVLPVFHATMFFLGGRLYVFFGLGGGRGR